MDREAIEEAIEVLEDASAQMLMETGDENYYDEAIAVLKQALGAEQKTAVSPGKGTGFIDARALGITVLRQALVDADDTSQKCVDEMVKTEHDRAVELGQAYERGWNAALAQQEPVAWLSTDCIGERYLCFTKPKDNDPVQPLYTTPPKREWFGLTEEDMEALFLNEDGVRFARYIEAKLREKNA